MLNQLGHRAENPEEEVIAKPDDSAELRISIQSYD